MIPSNKDRIVIMGAGKIGRSFIGQLFSRGGYEVIFIDADTKLIEELNRRGTYSVVIKAQEEQVLRIENVRGISVFEEEQAAEEIAEASIMAVCVGLNNIPKIAPLVSKGLLKRYQKDPNLSLDIILAENLRDAADYFHERLEASLPDNYPLNSLVGLVETSIGKMVPIMRQKDLEEDMLQVFAEPYNTLILDKKAFKNPIPEIAGLAAKENMKAWVDRKLFIHNLGHAAAAYYGYLYDPDFVFLYEPLKVEKLYKLVRDTMLQAADVLIKKYPEEFTTTSLVQHIDDLLQRFQNIHLGDTIFRVGCDLRRKLGSQDRLAGAIHLARELELPYELILLALTAGFKFRAGDEKGNMFPGDLEFEQLSENGLKPVLTTICGFDQNKDIDLINSIEMLANNLNQEYFRKVIL